MENEKTNLLCHSGNNKNASQANGSVVSFIERSNSKNVCHCVDFNLRVLVVGWIVEEREVEESQNSKDGGKEKGTFSFLTSIRK